MKMKTAIEICRKHKCRCYASTDIREDGTTRTRFGFWGVNREIITAVMRELNVVKAEKRFISGDEDWKIGNATFNRVRRCKIIGYKKEVVPEHIKETAIYDCNGEKGNDQTNSS